MKQLKDTRMIGIISGFCGILASLPIEHLADKQKLWKVEYLVTPEQTLVMSLKVVFMES